MYKIIISILFMVEVEYQSLKVIFYKSTTIKFLIKRHLIKKQINILG